jgi:hypothetical protein
MRLASASCRPNTSCSARSRAAANDLSATVGPQNLILPTSLDAAGVFNPGGTEPALGYSDQRRYVLGRLTSAAPLTAGKWNVLVRYYTKFD